jgi:hypothetical protein
MARHPILHPWQEVRTNVQVPKRIRSGPIKSGENNLAPRNLGKKRTYRKRGTWSEESIRLALDAVKSKRLSIRHAGELYGIPPSSIQDWKIGKTSSKKIGHQTYLTEFEEMALVEWCFTMQKVALCVTLNMLKCTIQTIMKNALRTHPFRK